MDSEKKPELGSGAASPKRRSDPLVLLLALLRLATVATTSAAALVMGLNRQTKTMSMAMVGTTPIYQTFQAKFQHTPAFVYFVISNAVAAGYNLLALFLGVFAGCKARAPCSLLLHLADMVAFGLVATGAAAAAAMAELGKNGNYHARWFPTCNTFGAFCDRGRAALAVAFAGAALLLVQNALSAVAIYRNVGKPLIN